VTGWFQEILSSIESNGFPNQFPLKKQGIFAIGYYHQRKDFFTKKDTRRARRQCLKWCFLKPNHLLTNPMNYRYDFIFLFDAQDANPNGDPDAGNLPRVDVESGQGLVTDVCLKRKIRNFIAMTANGSDGKRIYFTEGAVHNLQHKDAHAAVGISTG